MKHHRHVISVALLVASASCTTSDDELLSRSDQAVGSGLELELASATDVRGQFWSENGTVRFTSHTEPRRSVTATMELGESRISIEYDALVGDAGTMTFEVSGELVARERMALGELSRALGERFPEAGDAERPSAGLLRTYTDYFQSWSLGATDPKLVIPIPARMHNDPDYPIPGDPGPPPPKPTPPGSGSACNVTGDNDFVTELPQCCNGGTQVAWQHDAVDHCFTTNTNLCGFSSYFYGGPFATQCPGRCGPNCDPSMPLYTQDCLDHDLCLMHHQGLAIDPLGNCGDELLDAVDDVGYVYVGRLGWSVPLFTGCHY